MYENEIVSLVLFFSFFFSSEKTWLPFAASMLIAIHRSRYKHDNYKMKKKWTREWIIQSKTLYELSLEREFTASREPLSIEIVFSFLLDVFFYCLRLKREEMECEMLWEKKEMQTRISRKHLGVFI